MYRVCISHNVKAYFFLNEDNFVWPWNAILRWERELYKSDFTVDSASIDQCFSNNIQ